MLRMMKRRSRKVGLPPGTPVYLGEKRVGKVKVTLIDYDTTSMQEKSIKEVEKCSLFREKPTVTWINIDGVYETDIIEKMGKCFDLHPLVLEDILNTDQRPKIEDFDEYLFLVVKMLDYDEKRKEMTTEQLSLILGNNFVISFQEQKGDVFAHVRERIRSGKGRIRKMGADYLAYALLDAIVDNYFIVLEHLGEKIESLEEELLSNPSTKTLQVIHALKRDMVFLRKSVWPLREAISRLERGESTLVSDSIRIYIKDVYDHTIQVIDTVETFRDMVSGMLDIYLSSVSNKMNEVMKVLTIVATIFIPLGFIAGLYGMNFNYMPELTFRWGYPAILIGMGVVGASMLIYFRKKKWL